MNKRQKKKLENKIQDAIASGFDYFATYRELRNLDREYHEYVIQEKRKDKVNSWQNTQSYVDNFVYFANCNLL